MNPEWLAGVVLGVLLVAGCWPRFGVIARWRAARDLAGRMIREDALKHILKAGANDQAPTLLSVAGALQISQRRAAGLLAALENQGLVSFAGGRLQLSDTGRELALHVVRSHRLWESYLADQTGVAESQWHRRAERQEHLLSPAQTSALAAALGHPTHDPHGDAIPDEGEALPGEAGLSLGEAAVDRPVIITHVEDEPPAVYAQLTALGLRPGIRLRVVERSAARLRLRVEGQEHWLAPMLASNVTVAPLAEARPAGFDAGEPLASLRTGQLARVVGLTAACRGAERRRLLDLGFVPGTEVAVEMVSPLRDPVAYRVRGTVVALRRDQASLIWIVPEPVPAS